MRKKRQTLPITKRPELAALYRENRRAQAIAYEEEQQRKTEEDLEQIRRYQSLGAALRNGKKNSGT